MSSCTLCPRNCGVDRSVHPGRCGCTDEIMLARVMLHEWEEPCISGTRGSGAVFFCGCPLGCSFCQNREISRRGKSGFADAARSFSVEGLSKEFLTLAENGAHNINLVSPTQYTDQIKIAVARAKNEGLTLPVVWNTGGYEKPDTIASLKGTADVFLTDVKYYSPEISAALSGAADYFENALPSLREMIKVAGEPEYDADGIMKRGVIVRHLVLPGCRHDSEKILEVLAAEGLDKKIVLSLMSQYTPDFFTGCPDAKLDRALRRRVTSFEYDSVVDTATRLGFDGYIQERESAQTKYTPKWGF